MPMPVLDDTGTKGESPPYSSGTTSSTTSSRLTRSGLASGLSDLVIATTMGNTSGLGVLDGFPGLGHDTVVRSHHQNHDIGGLGTTGTHGGERLVTGSIQEGHHAARRFNVVGADVLRDAAGFARCHLGATDVVEQRGLAMVHVAHDGHHGGAATTRHPVRDLILGKGFRIIQRGHNCLGPISSTTIMAVSWSSGWFIVTIWPIFISAFDDLGGLDRHLVRQFGHGDRLGHMHFDDACLRRRCMGVLIATTVAVVAATAAAAAWGQHELPRPRRRLYRHGWECPSLAASPAQLEDSG